jgi:myo-inositol 2-dehydrogenase/D-chiro-inositol 1-dehydrogenase
VKIAVIGAGRIGAVHAANLVAGGEVDEVRVFDPDPVAAAVPGAVVASGLEQALDGADAAVIATPTADHPDHIRAVAAVGLPIFCEKPISLDLATSQAVVEAVRAAGVELQVGFQRRFEPGFVEMRRLVATGSLGEVYLVRAASHDHHPPHESYLTKSGSIFRDMHIHDFDALPWLVGQRVVRVHAQGAVLIDEMYARHGDVDTCAMVLTFEHGPLGVITGARADALGYDHRTEVFGSADSVCAGLGPHMPMRSADPGVPQPVDPYPSFPVRFADAYRAEMDAFVELVAGRAPNRCPGASSVDALRLAVAAERSLASGRPVDVADVTT